VKIIVLRNVTPCSNSHDILPPSVETGSP